MSDKLKEWIENKREDFEIYEYDAEQGWSDLKNHHAIGRVRSKLLVWKSIAAMVSLLLLAAMAVIYIQHRHARPYPQELVEAQIFYQRQIDQKIAQVRQQPGSELIAVDFEQLDAAFEELKADLEDDVHNDAVVTAMIDNYRLKLKILEEILEELEKKENENESYPGI